MIKSRKRLSVKSGPDTSRCLIEEDLTFFLIKM
jgi:hypothetical protein